jgi:hypothetical protein
MSLIMNGKFVEARTVYDVIEASSVPELIRAVQIRLDTNEWRLVGGIAVAVLPSAFIACQAMETTVYREVGDASSLTTAKNEPHFNLVVNEL